MSEWELSTKKSHKCWGLLLLVVVAFLACQQEKAPMKQEPAKQEDKEAVVQLYYAVMASMEKDPPAMLSHAVRGIGRRPDDCVRFNEKTDRCSWFLSEDRTIMIAVLSLNLTNARSGSDPSAGVRTVVFEREGRVERKIDGAPQQPTGQPAVIRE